MTGEAATSGGPRGCLVTALSSLAVGVAMFVVGVVVALTDQAGGPVHLWAGLSFSPGDHPVVYGLFVVANTALFAVAVLVALRLVVFILRRGLIILAGGALLLLLGLAAAVVGIFAGPIGLDTGQRVLMLILCLGFGGLGLAMSIADLRERFG